MSDLSDSLQTFVSYVQTHLTGDEKGEAAEFLDHLFRALGHDGLKEAGASRENRILKKGRAKDLLPRQILARLVDDCREKSESSYDLIGCLFRQMNNQTPARGGRFTVIAR